MPIFETATHQVKPEAVDEVLAAIGTFVRYVTEHEPGTRMYAAWQQANDPTRFVHLFIFDDKEAQRIHGSSEAVATFEAAYGPNLVGGPVVFTDFVQVATNT
jgi:quinol monooxygenase YgiN